MRRGVVYGVHCRCESCGLMACTWTWWISEWRAVHPYCVTRWVSRQGIPKPLGAYARLLARGQGAG